MLGLPVRRSAAPPAPRSPFESLPEGPLGLITLALSRRPGLDACRDVFNVCRTSKTFQAAMANEVHAKRHFLRVPMVGKAQQLVRAFLSGHPTAETTRLCLPALRLLSPRQQARLIEIQLDPESRDLHDPSGPADAFEKFAPQLAHLDKPLRAELAERASRYEDDEAAAKAIGGLSASGGLAHLDEASIERLVDTATRLKNEKWRACALSSLSRGWAHMSAAQRQRMWQAATDSRDPQAIVGLCAQLKRLPSAQRNLLFDRVLRLPHSLSRTEAWAGLAASVEALNPEQKQALLTRALSLPNDTLDRECVVCTLAAGVAHLDPDALSRLVDAILAMQSARAMAALGPALAHLPPEQQDQVLDAMADLDDEGKAVAIAGLAAAWPSLAPARRGRMVDQVLGMDSGIHLAEAIGALGPHLKHLEEGRRDAVVERALHLLGHAAARGAITQDPVLALAAGLGAGMQALRDDQRGALVDAVAAMGPHRAVGKCDFHNLKTIAAAIAGLASGQQHLSELQFKTLIEAADRLELDVAVAAGLAKNCGRPDEIKAVAYFGLAMG